MCPSCPDCEQKVRKTAISPVPLPKGISRTAAAPKAPAAGAAAAAKRAPVAAKKKTNVINLDSDEEEEEGTAAAAAAAPAPRAAPAAGGFGMAGWLCWSMCRPVGQLVNSCSCPAPCLPPSSSPGAVPSMTQLCRSQHLQDTLHPASNTPVGSHLDPQKPLLTVVRPVMLCCVLYPGGRARRAPARTYAESDDDEEMSEDQDDSSDYCASD
jgi:hypothetical protein